MTINRSHFEEACGSGVLQVEDWCEGFLALISDPAASNRDVLAAAQAAGRALGYNDRQRWLDDLVEFTLWESGLQPHRLDLCDYVVRLGLAQFDPPWRWRSGPVGGLLHIACEGASYEGVLWALQRSPGSILRRGGSSKVSVAHTLANRGRGENAGRIWRLLADHGARADALSEDGRTALFRCYDPELASALMHAGADPWRPDALGFVAASFWLESGNWDCARLAFALHPEKINTRIPWGTFVAKRYATPPCLDLPLFIVACSSTICMDSPRAGLTQREILDEMVDMGADARALDHEGLSLYERSGNPVALALQERCELDDLPFYPQREAPALSSGRL